MRGRLSDSRFSPVTVFSASTAGKLSLNGGMGKLTTLGKRGKVEKIPSTTSKRSVYGATEGRQNAK
jgi:hypothetical protein